MTIHSFDVQPSVGAFDRDTGVPSLTSLQSTVTDQSVNLPVVPNLESIQSSRLAAVQPETNFEFTFPLQPASQNEIPLLPSGQGTQFNGVDINLAGRRHPLGLMPDVPFTVQRGANGVTSMPGYREAYGRIHYGIDFSYGAEGSSPIVASLGGTVAYAGFNSGGFGYMVAIRLPDGTYDIYAHLHTTPNVRTGQQVSRGQVLGLMGNSGWSDGAHLHFERRGPGATWADGERLWDNAGEVASAFASPVNTASIDPHAVLDAVYRGQLRPLQRGDGGSGSIAGKVALASFDAFGWLAQRDPQTFGSLAVSQEQRVPQFNEDLVERISRYQSIRGLPQTGALDPITYAALRAEYQRLGHSSIAAYPDTPSAILARVNSAGSVALSPADSVQPSPTAPGVATIDLNNAPLAAADYLAAYEGVLGWNRGALTAESDLQALRSGRQIFQYMTSQLLTRPEYQDIAQRFPSLRAVNFSENRSPFFGFYDVQATQALTELLLRERVINFANSRALTPQHATGFLELLNKLETPQRQ